MSSGMPKLWVCPGLYRWSGRLTKHIITVIRIGCNICDSPNIAWNDREGDNHLCQKCLEDDQ
jgi:hypothetical protein